MDTDEEELTKFESLINELRIQLLHASSHLDIWEHLWPTKEAVDVLNQYKGFFNFTRDAHLDRFIIKVCNVLSHDPKSPSFYRVLTMVSKNPNLAPGISTRALKNRFKKHNEVINAIQEYRNERSAHWEMEMKKERKPVLLGKSKSMIKELQDIFNEISQAHSRDLWAFEVLEHRDTSRLLNNLKLL